MNQLNSYFEYLKNQMNVSEHTLHKYEQVLVVLNEYAGEQETKIEDLSMEQLSEFQRSIKKKNYAKTSVALWTSVIKSFYAYLLREGINQHNPASALEYPKLDARKLPTTLAEKEVLALIESIDIDRRFGKRNKAMMAILYSTGMRISEIQSLQVKMFDHYSETLTVVGKGNKERIVFNNRYTYDAVRDYIDLERGSLCQELDNQDLWINNHGQTLTDRGIRYVIDQVVENSAVMVKISPHTIRHCFATHLLNAGMGIRQIQELLGHESISTTQVYTHLDATELAKQFNALNIRK